MDTLESGDSKVNWPQKRYLIKALSRFPAPPVFEAISLQLVEFTLEDEATEALVDFGSAAEEAVCQMLESHSERARENAAKILQKIGTKRSLGALREALQKEVDTFLKDDIRDTLEAVRRR